MNGAIYEERSVLFLDILGFKKLVEENNEEQIYQALGISALFAQAKPSFPDLIHTTSFSDSIVISYRLASAGVQYIILFANMLAWSFLRLGILTRGGIACGNIHHTSERLYGPAMNEAYKIESELAIFPRILVSDDIKAFIMPEDPTVNPVCAQDVLRQDFDGGWHVNIMSPSIVSPFDLNNPDNEKLYDNKVKIIKEALLKPCPPYGENKSARAKHDWLSNYLQASIQECGARKGK